MEGQNEHIAQRSGFIYLRKRYSDDVAGLIDQSDGTKAVTEGMVSWSQQRGQRQRQ